MHGGKALLALARVGAVSSLNASNSQGRVRKTMAEDIELFSIECAIGARMSDAVGRGGKGCIAMSSRADEDVCAPHLAIKKVALATCFGTSRAGHVRKYLCRQGMQAGA